MNILLTSDQESTLRSLSNCCIFPNGDEWYFMPYWWKSLGNGMYEQVRFENLPDKVKEYILAEREIKI